MNIYHRADDSWKTDPGIVFIGRPSIWGNPFTVKDHGRLLAIAKYETYLKDNKDLREKLCSLYGKRLACYCFPNSCHGDVILKYVHGYK